jgi:hypothetical protein
MPRAKKKIETKFTYAIGRPWYPEKPDSTICFYMYGSEIFNGTLTDAKTFRDYCNGVSERDHKEEKKKGPAPKYRIYQVVEIPGSEDL